MARTKEFDPDVALRATLELFWRQGHEATSMRDLVDHLGIGRASIYATFGSKNELHLRALTRCRDGLGGRYRTLSDGAGSALSRFGSWSSPRPWRRWPADHLRGARVRRRPTCPRRSHVFARCSTPESQCWTSALWRSGA
ncbi:helix-turn-helix domain-containing protein [Kutzneria sp. NPDC051319]|uniref:helix-turn-helix domain-containing protein n=1 Tax=Kutzneria sp. NPDC051319 TaxID=3155047 RepID=UPI0034336D00